MSRLLTITVSLLVCIPTGRCDEVDNNDRSGGSQTNATVADDSGAPRGDATRSSACNFESQPLARIPAGTRFVAEPPTGWSNIILFVVPRLASGDVEAVSSTIARYSELFNVVILANSLRSASGTYHLEKVALGTSTKIDGQNTIITSDSQERLGARLNVIGSTVLSGNEKELAELSQAARSPTTMLIDAPLRMLHEDKHRMMTCRFAIWVVPDTGEIGTLAWLLDDPEPQQKEYVLVEEAFQYLPKNMREDRVLNVREDLFFLGIPGGSAFAAVRIPQGTPFRYTAKMKAYAGQRRFDYDSYCALWMSITESLAQGSAP
jgi:hypothetical protein